LNYGVDRLIEELAAAGIEFEESAVREQWRAIPATGIEHRAIMYAVRMAQVNGRSYEIVARELTRLRDAGWPVAPKPPAPPQNRGRLENHRRRKEAVA
jgi:hypothetical protein